MKRVLIVSPYFAPENAIASIRFTKVAKYLNRMGYEIVVICVRNMVTNMEDEILKEDIKDIESVYRLDPISFNQKVKSVYSRAEKENAQNKNERKKSIFDALTTSRVYQSFLENWIYYMEVLLGRKLISFVKENKIGEFDCVISTYGPLSSLMLGQYMRKTGLCKKLIVDFRDVVTDATVKGKRIRRKRMKMLAQASSNADLITTIAPEMRESIDQYLKKFRMSRNGDVHFIPNGFDPEDRRYIEKSFVLDGLNFAYCGTVYNKGDKILRNPAPLFKALYELENEGKIMVEKVHVHYAGGDSDTFLKVAECYGMKNVVVNHGRVKRNESLNIQRSADVVLSLSWNTKKEKGILTGKIYEAFLTERPILCLVSGDEPNSKLGEIIRTSHSGFVWEEGSGDTIQGLKDWILRSYNEKMKIGKIVNHCKKEEIEKYSYGYLTKQFEELL